MKRSLALLALVAMILSALVVVRLLALHDFNPTTTIKFGEVFEEHNEYAEELLGEVVLAPEAGHDGKFFFSQAMDPFYLEPEDHAIYLDRPSYRAQRMAYPTLASLGGTLGALGTAWGLIAVNIVAMVVGSVYTGLAATRMNLSPWFGLAFLFNPGMIVELGIDGGGVVAMAGMMAGVYYMLQDRVWLAAVALSIAALARETMLIAAIGLAAFILFRCRRLEWKLAMPVTVVGAWWVYVRARLDEALAQDTQALALPFQGIAGAFRGWVSSSGDALDLVVGCVVLLVALMVVVRSAISPTALGWAAAGFALLGVILSEPVWAKWFDSTRALAPVLTAYILMVPATSRTTATPEELRESEIPLSSSSSS
ncbi:MAG: hypothetical protein ACLFRT_14695 [Actinomycetota bacterium]